MTTIKKAVKGKSGTVAKKAVVQKAATKRNLKKAKRVLVCAGGEQCFWTTDGTIVSNLVELKSLFDTMDEAVFGNHVTSEKNDFADWVEFVLGDTELAASLRKVKKQSAARTVVVTRLKIYDI
ncbi:MAG: hypothetical protein K9M10_01795 [Candidatus Pacebacteria bacterium]|nr:hypothetical protein [Candidatus Paceibacterota bacterium]MCF7857196.1 hypothetical protein [Candidatus Paceibacterota bacterium]